MIDYRLYLVTDDPSRYAGNWLDNVVAAVEGGVTCVQYRDTESSREEQYRRIIALRDALKGSFASKRAQDDSDRVPIIVNNDAELAAAVKAEGVHVGQNDMPVEEVRKIVGPDCEIGLSITDISQVSNLQASKLPNLSISKLPKLQVSCLGIGPVFDARKTKSDASEAMGVEGLAGIINSLSQCGLRAGRVTDSYPPCPHGGSANECKTVAIGGITLENAASVLSTGVGGLAVVSAFSKSENSYEVARNFTMLFDHCGV